VHTPISITSYIIHHTSHIIHQTSYIIHHTSYIIHHTFLSLSLTHTHISLPLSFSPSLSHTHLSLSPSLSRSLFFSLSVHQYIKNTWGAFCIACGGRFSMDVNSTDTASLRARASIRANWLNMSKLSHSAVNRACLIRCPGIRNSSGVLSTGFKRWYYR